MTFLEKLMKDLEDGKLMGVMPCPGEMGYEPDNYACDEMPSCKACWERQMPASGGPSAE